MKHNMIFSISRRLYFCVVAVLLSSLSPIFSDEVVYLSPQPPKRLKVSKPYSEIPMDSLQRQIIEEEWDAGEVYGDKKDRAIGMSLRAFSVWARMKANDDSLNVLVFPKPKLSHISDLTEVDDEDFDDDDLYDKKAQIKYFRESPFKIEQPCKDLLIEHLFDGRNIIVLLSYGDLSGLFQVYIKAFIPCDSKQKSFCKISAVYQYGYKINVPADTEEDIINTRNKLLNFYQKNPTWFVDNDGFLSIDAGFTPSFHWELFNVNKPKEEIVTSFPKTLKELYSL